MNIYIDIETYRGKDQLNELPDKLKDQFIRRYCTDQVDPNEEYNQKAALYPEYGKIICISVGYEDKDGNYKTYSCMSLTDEVKLLTEFSKMTENWSDSWILVGYNIKLFDIPFIIKRFIINGLNVPRYLRNIYFQKESLNLIKPWESHIIDLLDVWKGTSPRATSLEVLCTSLGIQSKSESIDGTNMFLVPLDEMDGDELKKYCEEDTYVCYLLYKTLTKYIFNL